MPSALRKLTPFEFVFTDNRGQSSLRSYIIFVNQHVWTQYPRLFHAKIDFDPEIKSKF